MKRVKRLLAACLALAALLPLGAQELSQQQQDLLQLQKFAQIYRYLTNAYVDGSGYRSRHRGGYHGHA